MSTDDTITIIVEGATSGVGAVTGRQYRIPAGESQRLENVPKGELDTFPDNRVTVVGESTPDRQWEGSGSWKTMYEDGEQVGKVQCKAQEADAWAAGDLELADIQ